MSNLRLYSIFHLNLAYSSIPESKRAEVIQRCFWPLLRLATEDNIPIAIEAPAYTLEVADKLDSKWVHELKKAIFSKKVEFLGSGYSQLIAPIAPADVNVWNLQNGIKVYKELLNFTPGIWFINEQAYSSGIVEHYVHVGAKAIIMEWNNPRALHPEWDNEYRYYPQIAIGNNGSAIPVLWNDSVSFQKLQRYAHNDIGLDEMFQYLINHVGEQSRFFCLYGNDAEIFDFRPGRFKTEPKLVSGSEWSRIRELYCLLRDNRMFEHVLPSNIIDSRPASSCFSSGISLSLGSSVQPVPVKKQPKYNLTRWQVTGRNSIWLNARCYEIYQMIGLAKAKGKGLIREEDVRKFEKQLCYLWSSDFRTHIVYDRWQLLINQVEKTKNNIKQILGVRKRGNRSFEIDIKVNNLNGSIFFNKQKKKSTNNPFANNIIADDRFIRIQTNSVNIVLNGHRGLAMESLAFPMIYSKPLIGTIKHGYFEEISLSADWYSAATVLQRPGKPQITDLGSTAPVFIGGISQFGPWIECSADIKTEIGIIHKKFTIYQEIPQIDLEFTFHWKKVPLGSFRTGFITLLPQSFDLDSLFYATHNGGYDFEIYHIRKQSISHGEPISSVVTATSGIGATQGVVVIGDRKKGVAAYFDQGVSAAMPMISFRSARPSFFGRLMFSLGEMDESRNKEGRGPIKFSGSITGINRGERQ